MTATLDGKRALITGAGGGMGQSHAVLMAERGADIVIHDIKADGAEETAEMVRAHGREATVVVADTLGERRTVKTGARSRRAWDGACCTCRGVAWVRCGPCRETRSLS